MIALGQDVNLRLEHAHLGLGRLLDDLRRRYGVANHETGVFDEGGGLSPASPAAYQAVWGRRPATGRRLSGVCDGAADVCDVCKATAAISELRRQREP